MRTLILSILLLFGLSASAQFLSPGFFRTMYNSNPANGFTVGFSVLPTSQLSDYKLYYSNTDHGTNLDAYAADNEPLEVSRTVTLMKGLSHYFFRLENLTPSSNYYFVIEYSNATTLLGGVSERYYTRTMSDNPDNRISFIAGGDSRLNLEEGPEPLLESITIRKESNKLVSKLNVDFVAFGGDYTFGNTEPEWLQWFADWELTFAEDGRITPIVAAIGNHEVLPFGCPQCDNSVIYNMFDTPSEDNYYAITFGGNLLRLYTLNTEMAIAGDQTSWLVNDLKQNKNVFWKSAQYHKPIRPHEAGKSDNNEAFENWALPFYEEQVRLVIECDAHVVKSTYPLYPSMEADGSLICGEPVEQNFARIDNGKGTTFIGEGTWAAIREGDDPKIWTRDLGTINQFKWIFVDKNEIQARTVQTYKNDNPNYVDNIETLDNRSRFTEPEGITIWEGQQGPVISITNNGMSPVPSNPCQTVGINNNGVFANELTIAPNPSKGIINIKLGRESINSTVEIFAMNGKLVYRNSFSGKNFTLNIKEKSQASAFLVSVKNINGEFLEKVIMQ